ncbi:hypothetical protein HK098_006901 [Nowakowskiella sp. JEL0407]|nr:hypothetical protein HK098_006901 [Nowakowskiella sp. JEL0407]
MSQFIPIASDNTRCDNQLLNPEKHSENIVIEELAKKAVNKTPGKMGSNFRVPFVAVMVLFSVVLFAVAVIPTCVIVFSSAKDVTSDLSGKIMNSVVINLSSQLSFFFISVKSSTDQFLLNDATRRVMANLSTGYGGQDDINRAAYATLKSAPFIERLVCVQKAGPSTSTPIAGYGRNLPSYIFSNYNDTFFITWCDYGNVTDCFDATYDFNTKTLGTPRSDPYQKPYQVENGFITQKLNNCESPGSWASEAGFGFAMFSYARCAPDIPGRTQSTTGIAPYSCGAAFSSAYLLPPILQNMAPTKNSRVALVDKNGSMIVTNLNGLVYPIMKNSTTGRGGVFIKAHEFSDPVIQQVASLISPDGSYSQLKTLAVDTTNLSIMSTKPLTEEYQLKDGEYAGAKYITAVMKAQFGTSEEYYVILAVPREDFFGPVDKSIKMGIGLSSLFVGLGILVGAFVTIGILMPLTKLKNNMSKVTKFDFSMMSNGGLDERSVFTEVHVVQKTFNIMVKAFAAAIQRNREISTRKNLFSSFGSNNLATGSASSWLLDENKSVKGYLGGHHKKESAGDTDAIRIA